MEQGTRERALKAAIQEGLESGVSDKTVPEIMKDVEARLRANARLWTDAEVEHPPGEG